MDAHQVYRELSGLRDLGCHNQIVFSRVPSTNTVGKAIARACLAMAEETPSTAILAVEQTRGRGRMERSWLSPPGGIYSSLILDLPDHVSVATLPLRIGIALGETLARFVERACRLKWPNDLMVDGRKLGGILLEAVARGDRSVLVIGFGVNYALAPAADAVRSVAVMELASTGISLGELTGRLVRAVVEATERHIAGPELVREYASHSVHQPGESISVDTTEGRRIGRFLGFDTGGGLRIETESGEERIVTGDLIESFTRGEA